MRPTGMLMVPVTATGVKCCKLASRLLGTTFTHSLSAAIMASMSAKGTFFVSLKVSAWLWQRIAPMRTQKPSTGTAAFAKPGPWPKILLVSAMPFHSSRLVPQNSSPSFLPSPKSLSIQGRSEPPKGAPKFSISAAESARCFAMTLRSISKIALLGSFKRSLTSAYTLPNWVSNSRICAAPPPEAAW